MKVAAQNSPLMSEVTLGKEKEISSKKNVIKESKSKFKPSQKCEIHLFSQGQLQQSVFAESSD